MNNAALATYPKAPTDSGRHKVQSYTNVGGVAEKTELFTGLGADAPIGKCVVRFFLVDANTIGYYHVEGSAGAADASATNGFRGDGYYGPMYHDFVVDPRSQTHLDFFAAAGVRISWVIVSAENQSHPGG